MPRQARLDIPGLLQHVIVRGIERRNIFRDNTDRKNFVERFNLLLQETGTECFAWALIPNHFHLLLRPNLVELKQFMRRLLTGYAITFNNRHRRSGHLFQNRYKSIVCEEDTYLLELIRYIHLNPLRASIVPDLTSLNNYKWCGHSILMGKNQLSGQSVDEVLAFFDKKPNRARVHYLSFVADGIAQGERPELVGGGLKRSVAGGILTSSASESYDERVLGSGDFVDQLRQEDELREKLILGVKLPELMRRVEIFFDLEPGQLSQRKRRTEVVTARDVFCHVAVRILKHPGTEVGACIYIKRSAVSHAVRRGGDFLASSPEIVGKLFE